jgi:hypothetical protein
MHPDRARSGLQTVGRAFPLTGKSIGSGMIGIQIPNHMTSPFLWTILGAIIWSGAALGQSEAKSPTTADPRCFELRTYYAAPGKLDALQARFREHTSKLFEKHGMRNIGYWVPVENPDNKLIYVLAFPSREAAKTSWKAFGEDPDWKKVQKASESNGRLVTKADSVFLQATDYSPAIKPSTGKSGPRLFELRTYTATPGKLADLNARFRDKTVKLFAKHDITSIAYWVPTDKAQGADDTLIYIVAHPDKESADNDWKAFRDDFEWVAAKRFSEANGPLTMTNGVKSVYLKPTDFSPIK